MIPTLLLLALPILTTVATLATGATGAQRDGETPIRTAIQRYFTQLKSGQYRQLYDSLPASFRQQTTREEVTESLKRLGQSLQIQRIEIGKVEQHGELAVASTTIYGRLAKPLTLNGREIEEGRVTSLQYLIREDGRWKIASATERALRSFFQEHPEAATRFTQSHTRFELLSNGAWVRLPGSR
jgi:hypothetical protein